MLEAEVVVKARSVVLLDDKAGVLSGAHLGLAAGFGGLLEIPLGCNGEDYLGVPRRGAGFTKGIPSPRVPKEMVELASHILDKKAGHFDPAKFKDEYELALRKLVKRKASGKTIEPTEPAEDRSNVIDLMAALQQSLGRAGAKAKPGKAKSKARKQGGRRAS
jgi:hypothetical protein